METLYIIDPENFNGTVNTGYEKDGQVYMDYSSYLYNNNAGDLTIDEYIKHPDTKDTNLIALQWPLFLEKYYEPYLKSLQGKWLEISQEDYYQSLECLPPVRWHDFSPGLNVFFCSEAYTAHLHSAYIRDKENNKYYTARRSIYITDIDLIKDFTSQMANFINKNNQHA